MEKIKHKSLPFEKTIEVKRILGKKVLTNDGKSIGKIKSIHVHPTDLTIEGVKIERGMFEVDQYIDENYIKSLGEEAVILKISPVTELVGKSVYDKTGKNVGKVKKVNRSKQTNTLMSITIDAPDMKEELVITPDYIIALGEGVMLKEAL